METIQVKMKKSERERLGQIALRYGLSLPELARKILSEVREEFETESFDEYENAANLKKSLKNALRDYKKGNILTKL